MNNSQHKSQTATAQWSLKRCMQKDPTVEFSRLKMLVILPFYIYLFPKCFSYENLSSYPNNRQCMLCREQHILTLSTFHVVQRASLSGFVQFSRGLFYLLIKYGYFPPLIYHD